MMPSEIAAPRRPTPLLFSIIMPAYNEAAVVEKTLASLTAHLDAEGFDYEILVIDDASVDETPHVIDRFAARHPRVRRITNPGPNGYGFAIRKGLDEYKGDAMVIVTADGADAPKDIAAYFRKIEEGYDCAFGSRFMEGATVTGYPRAKLVVNRFANFAISRVLGVPYNDLTNGFKCYRRHVIDAMQPLVAGQFNITIELGAKALLGGYNYAVVPNDWAQRDAGVSSFKLLKLMKPYGTTFLYCLAQDYLKNVRR
jgi:dolichol-phosphate mannosyltransferase